jgi:hypothetical protein
MNKMIRPQFMPEVTRRRRMACRSPPLLAMTER